MSTLITCRRCNVGMEPGTLADAMEQFPSTARPQRWMAGEPRSDFGWFKEPKDSLLVITFRCPSCGILESYAPQLKGKA